VPIAAAGALGYAGQWCWIRPAFGWMRFVFLYIPLLAVLAYHAVTYVLVRQRFRQLQSDVGGASPAVVAALPALTARFARYAAVFATVWVFSMLNRLHDALVAGEPSFSLAALSSAFGPLQGLGNAVVYGWSPRVRSLYATSFPAICSCLADRGLTATEVRRTSCSPGGALPSASCGHVRMADSLAECTVDDYLAEVPSRSMPGDSLQAKPAVRLDGGSQVEEPAATALRPQEVTAIAQHTP